MLWRSGLPVIGVLAALLAARVAVADVYVGVAPDGHPAYTSQPEGAGYRLLYRDPVVAVNGRSTQGAFSVRESALVRRQRERLEPLILRAASAYALDPALLRAVIHVESRFNPAAVSRAGAAGAMQLMHGTAQRYGVTNRSDPAQNVDAGARYLRDLLKQFNGNTTLALSAYNAGENAVERHSRRIPPYRETMTYVPEVLARLEGYRDAPGELHD